DQGLEGADRAHLRRRQEAVVDLLGVVEGRRPGGAAGRRVRGGEGALLGRGRGQRQEGAGALRVDQAAAQQGALGAVVLVRRRQDLGGQLDRGLRARSQGLRR